MTPEEQRVAIAQVLGWTDIVENPAKGKEPRGCIPNESFLGQFVLPNWPNSLDLMHQAEKMLNNEGQQYWYQRNLHDVIAREAGTEFADIRKLISATAAQRAEAFLRTIGLWKESPPTSPQVPATGAQVAKQNCGGEK